MPIICSIFHNGYRYHLPNYILHFIKFRRKKILIIKNIYLVHSIIDIKGALLDCAFKNVIEMMTVAAAAATTTRASAAFHKETKLCILSGILLCIKGTKLF